MNKAIERFIEEELYHYRSNKKEIEEFRGDIYDSSPDPPDGMPRGSNCSDPTANKAIRILTTKQILSLEKRLLAIEKVLDRYRDNKTMTQLIELRYFKRTRTSYGIMEDLGISQATFYRYRSELLQDIASELGLN